MKNGLFLLLARLIGVLGLAGVPQHIWNHNSWSCDKQEDHPGSKFGGETSVIVFLSVDIAFTWCGGVSNFHFFGIFRWVVGYDSGCIVESTEASWTDYNRMSYIGARCDFLPANLENSLKI